MKHLLIFLFFSSTLNAQFTDFEKEHVIFKRVKNSQTFKIKEFNFVITWDEKLSYSSNLERHYGGIKLLEICKKDMHITSFNNIEDPTALDEIVIRFYDYNLDGFIDFAMPISVGGSTWLRYYIYNPTTKKYLHEKEWDYLRIQKIDKTNKRILTQPDGGIDNRKLFKIEGSKLIKVKR
ncbi:XAC2610-related protein [Tenacibaculum finnmarkense]|uniref:Uncharacterized protein n=1 Tax=Tenacibaculum finnmarkense genomovar ulcerans TaxID=2781388 RepID=A0A2I2M6Y5_9FLAO|nr:hypothetical protein [Tenacibaculum finnmarkense]ALU75854.1 hypothetical protein AUW17_11605 [Tenacibaculum dicentrarchi]MBE7696442.1 hypothetical protein [Tenacibaculum finnmarkense genomovar ulcerans]MCD8409089.1 hypothetical protein [Tenacibaculum finnmarkense genomovar ulcerans]WCC44685.1 hypothetical protein PJW08_13980 [Tenacibaculum finnmarkense]SOU88303.1 conserved hypothetical protein [Tenacibaculum finnmarkense genomovar ulcerans]